jgi:hypothetical protein
MNGLSPSTSTGPCWATELWNAAVQLRNEAFATYMQIEFGRLISAQQRGFPEMASPTWVF